MREETREGGVHEDWGSKERGFGLKEWISMEEASESKSKEARTAKRSNAETRGSHRTASMYLYCGNLWILEVSEFAVTAIAKGFLQQQQQNLVICRKRVGTCFLFWTQMPLVLFITLFSTLVRRDYDFFM